MALPSFQSETVLVPNMYRLIVPGLMSASHTLRMGARIPIEALATILAFISV
jgi:hypothetical protein